MAPAEESVYFPPLERCLEDTELLTWKDVYQALVDSSPQWPLHPIRPFLSDKASIALLLNCVNLPAKPGSQSRSIFETLTAAINVTPTTNGRYDINQLKHDSLWLCEETGIDEIQALRIAVVEWQRRSAANILEEDRLRPTGIAAFSKSLGLRASLAQSRTKLAASQENEFDSETSRRLRLLRLFACERIHICKVADYLIFNATEIRETSRSESTEDDRSRAANATSKKGSLTVSALHTLYDQWSPSGSPPPGSKSFYVRVAEALRFYGQQIEAGVPWMGGEDASDALIDTWIVMHLSQMISLSRIMLVLLNRNEDCAIKVNEFRSWYRLMGESRFYAALSLKRSQDIANLEIQFKAIVSLISVSIINLGRTLTELDEPLSSENEKNPEASYIRCIKDLEECTQIFLDTRSKLPDPDVPVIAPAMLAWGLLQLRIKGMATALRETRDSKQSQRESDRYDAIGHSDNDSADGQGGRRPSPSRRSSFGSESSQQLTYIEEVADTVDKVRWEGNVAQTLTNVALHILRAFDVITDLAREFCGEYGSDYQGRMGLCMRHGLLKLVQVSSYVCDYDDDILRAILAVLKGNETIAKSLKRPVKLAYPQPAARFWEDPVIVERIFDNALARFPYESIPFLQLSQALCTPFYLPLPGSPSSIMGQLERLRTFTSLVMEQETRYQIAEEVEGAIELMEPLEVFSQAVPKTLQIRGNRGYTGKEVSADPTVFTIPAWSIGYPLTDGKPIVARWVYEYSGFQYMGLFLQDALSRKSQKYNAGREDILEIAASMIGLLTDLILTLNHQSRANQSLLLSPQAAIEILGEASSALDRGQDIMTVVFAFFEKELNNPISGSIARETLSMAQQCLSFTTALVRIVPGRVWAFLGRSSLIALDGSPNSLAPIISNLEIPSRRFDFLLGVLDLLDELIQDAATHAVSRRRFERVSSRFNDLDDEITGAGVSEVVMQKIVLTLIRVLVSAFESSGEWVFDSLSQGLQLRSKTCQICTKVLDLVYAIDESHEPCEKVTACLARSAEYIVEIFLPDVARHDSIQPLLQIFLKATASQPMSLTAAELDLWDEQTTSALRLNTLILKVGRYLSRHSTFLVQSLLEATPCFAKLYAIRYSYRLDVVRLLTELVPRVSGGNNQSKSWFGRMGEEAVKSFINLLSKLSRPLEDHVLNVSIWNLLTHIIKQRQQSLSWYLLKGTSPRENLLKDDPQKSPSVRARTMLQIAIDRLTKIRTIDQLEAIAALRFVSTSLNFWPWVSGEVESKTQLIASLFDFLDGIDFSQPDSASDGRGGSISIHIASLILDIFALIVHKSVETRDDTFPRQLIPHLQSLFKNATVVPDYNSSHHQRIKCHFATKLFTQLSLDSFKRTSLHERELGSKFYYNIDIAEIALSHSPGWRGNKNDGMFDELVRLNLNLSLVQAQIFLFYSWKSLLTEMIRIADKDAKFLQSVLGTIRDCLNASSSSDLTQEVFQNLDQVRADFTFTLLQHVSRLQRFPISWQGLLQASWDALRHSAPDVGLALVGSNAELTRTLLKIVCINLVQQQKLATKGSKSSEQSRIGELQEMGLVLEVVDKVAARGFRSLANLLYEDQTRVNPADFSLINTLLRNCLLIPGIEMFSERLLSLFDDDNTIHYATTLLSWSDKLLLEKDPVYAETALVFLFELSTMPCLAESLAINGVLSQVATANITTYFRRDGGIGAFQQPVRIYNIWARAILPLCLNLLAAIKAPIAPELSAFLNNFKPQLQRVIYNLDAKPVLVSTDSSAGLVTLAMASEIHSIAMISAIFDMLREAGPSVGLNPDDVEVLAWERAAVREDIEVRLSNRALFRAAIVPTNEREERWCRQPASQRGDAAQNMLEQKVVEELMAAAALLDV